LERDLLLFAHHAKRPVIRLGTGVSRIRDRNHCLVMAHLGIEGGNPALAAASPAAPRCRMLTAG
jgi:hypothetical protein